MKRLFFVAILLNAVLPLTSFAQDNTKVGLPEAAIGRLGKGGINLMRFSPDGTRLVVGTDVGVWLYDVPDGKETALFTGHTGQVNALAFSTDGKILASSGLNSPIIQLWDSETGNTLSTLPLPKEGRDHIITALAFAKDNTRLISLDDVCKITHWDVNTSSAKHRSKRVEFYEAVAVSQDSNTFATGDNDGKIRLRNTTTNRQLMSFGGDDWLWGSLKSLLGWTEGSSQDKEVRALAFSADGKMLASGSEDKMVRLWDIQKRSEHATLKGHKEWVTAVAFSADGKTVASGDAGKVIKLWDVGTGRERATLIGHKNTINALTFAPEATPVYSGCLASGSADGTIRFWDPDTGQELATFTAGHTEWIKAIAFSENGAALSTAAFNGTVKIWSLKTAQELTTFTHAESDLTAAVAFSSDATYFASRGGRGAIAFDPLSFGYSAKGPGAGNTQLWEITTGQEIPGPWNTKGGKNALTFSPDNKIFVAGRPRQGIRGWDINTQLELFHFDAAEPFGRQLAFSPNGNLLVTNGTHVQTRVWDVVTQAEITPPDIEKVSAAAFSPGGIILAHAHHRDGIVFWHVTPIDMKEHGRIPEAQGDFNDVLTFSPNGKILLKPESVGWQNHIQLWDVDTGSDLGTLSGHTENIETLVFSHDGKTLASGSRDGTVLLWDWDEIIAKRVAEQ